MNQIIENIWYSGASGTVYYGFHVIGFAAVFLFNIWYGKRYGMKKSHAVISTAIVYPLTYLWMLIQFSIEQGFFGGQNIVRCFIYIPLIAWPVTRLLNIRWKTMCDFLAPSPVLVHGISHLGCMFAGCCYGFEYTHGLYNPVFQKNLFPIQPIEALVALAIFALIVGRAVRRGFKSDGYSFPLMLLLFGSTRFLLEFLRDNEKVVANISMLAFHALLAAVVGTVWLAVLLKKRRAIQAA